jgi:hypothetical protein
MFTALTLSMTLGAPVPAQTAPVAAGLAPQVMELKANTDGKVMVTVRRTEKVPVNVGNAAIPVGGAQPAIQPAVITRTTARSVELGEVKDLTITTADGKKVSTEDAIKKIGQGAVVVISADGKPVSPVYLKVFKDDTLVLASPELVGMQTGLVRPGVRPLPAIQPGGVQILPINPGNIQIQPGNVQILPAQGGVIQFQVAPAVLPAPPPVPVEKAPPKNDK